MAFVRHCDPWEIRLTSNWRCSFLFPRPYPHRLWSFCAREKKLVLLSYLHNMGLTVTHSGNETNMFSQSALLYGSQMLLPMFTVCIFSSNMELGLSRFRTSEVRVDGFFFCVY